MAQTTTHVELDDFSTSLWARIVSDVFSPPMVLAVVAFWLSFQAAPAAEDALLFSLIYVVIVCLLPLLYVVWGVRTGRISDLHMHERHERIRPYMVSMACAGIAAGLLLLFHAPRVLPLFALFSLIQLALMAVITLSWQISMHTMSATSAVVAIGILGGWTAGLAALPIALLVAIARLRLRRHTPPQVLAGALIGALMMAVLFTLA